jgi:hypothetical protein
MTNDPGWRKRLRGRDPEAVRALNRRYYNSPAGQAARERQYERRRALVAQERARRGDRCQDCGWTDDLQWHHRNPAEKAFTLSYAIIKSYQAIRDELAKCDLLCPNCHARRHREMTEVA